MSLPRSNFVPRSACRPADSHGTLTTFQLRKFRSTATVEMLRTTWEKPLNPYVRLITWHFRPSLPFVRTLFIPRPSPGPRSSLPPIKVVIFFDGTASELSRVDEVVLDFPGGGFICMGPDCHEERLRYWGRRFGRSRKEGTKKRIVVSADYGKSPECESLPWHLKVACRLTITRIFYSRSLPLGHRRVL